MGLVLLRRGFRVRPYLLPVVIRCILEARRVGLRALSHEQRSQTPNDVDHSRLLFELRGAHSNHFL